MISHHAMKDLITVLKPGRVQDRYGNTISSWESPTGHPTHGILYMTAAREDVKYRDAEVGQYSLLLPAGAHIDHHDRVVCRGNRYEVTGVQPRGALGRVHHLSVRLRKVEGWDRGTDNGA
jgi:hypothetical protein